MPRQAIFAGLVFDELGNPAQTAFVGDEPCYVVNDQGFRRHISAEIVDRHIFEQLTQQVKGNEDLLSEQTAKMLGQDDLFSRAMIANQLKNLDRQFDQLLETGIPEEGRAYMGMMGFRVVIDIHGEVVSIEQPGAGIDGEDE